METDGPFRHDTCGGKKVLEHPVPWGNVTTLLVEVDTSLGQVISLDPDSPNRRGDLTWDEERERAPRLNLRRNGSRVDGKSRAGDLVTVYDLQDWNVLYGGVRQNVPSELLRCPPGFEGYRV